MGRRRRHRLPPLLPHGATRPGGPQPATRGSARGACGLPRPRRLGLPGRVLRALRRRLRRPRHLDRVGRARRRPLADVLHGAVHRWAPHLRPAGRVGRVGRPPPLDAVQQRARLAGRRPLVQDTRQHPRRPDHGPRPRGLQRDVARPGRPARPRRRRLAPVRYRPECRRRTQRRRVVAHATSQDLSTWTLGPPLCDPGAGFGQLEVLQNVVVAGRPVLAFTCDPQEQTAERIAEWGEYSTWSVPSPSVVGP